MAIAERFWRKLDDAWFWTLVVLHLVPVWAYYYLPTQDGPSHLANALIIKDYGSSATGFEDIFEIRIEQMPNWTSHLVLASLMSVVPPLIAEKLLVSVYILGFAGSFRYFLGSFGERCQPIAALGLVFLYNRCFWMGFYNYCLSLILVWLIIGFCLRRRGDLRWPQGLTLMFLFMLAYFTHLVGFGLAAFGAFAASILARPRNWLGPVVVAVAAAPSLCLTMDYFESTGFFQHGAARQLVRQPIALMEGGRMEQGVFVQLTTINRQLFDHAGPSGFLGLFVIIIFLAYVGVSLVQQGNDCWFNPPVEATEVIESDTATPQMKLPLGWFFPFLLGAVILGFYLLLADHLGSHDRVLSHGGFLKARFALVPPLIWLACLREPRNLSIRLILRSLTTLILLVNLCLVAQTIDAGNVELEEYTSGIPVVGRARRILAVQPDDGQLLVNPILHAADYYCLGTDNVNIDNYEAGTRHFPVRYRHGVAAGQTKGYDILLSWRGIPGIVRPGWEEIYSQGRLRIFRRIR
jgi:hypothetical protein